MHIQSGWIPDPLSLPPWYSEQLGLLVWRIRTDL